MQPPGNQGFFDFQKVENRERQRSPQLSEDTAAGYSEMEMRVRSVLFALRDSGEEQEKWADRKKTQTTVMIISI